MQFCNCKSKGFLRKMCILKPITSDVISHPMNADIRHPAVPAAEAIVKKSEDRNVSWKYNARDCLQSGVGCLQFSTDKSLVLLEAGSLAFYRLHVTLLKFSEEFRRKHITSGRIVCAYLSVSFQQNGISSFEATSISSGKTLQCTEPLEKTRYELRMKASS